MTSKRKKGKAARPPAVKPGWVGRDELLVALAIGAGETPAEAKKEVRRLRVEKGGGP